MRIAAHLAVEVVMTWIQTHRLYYYNSDKVKVSMNQSQSVNGTFISMNFIHPINRPIRLTSPLLIVILIEFVWAVHFMRQWGVRYKRYSHIPYQHHGSARERRPCAHRRFKQDNINYTLCVEMNSRSARKRDSTEYVHRLCLGIDNETMLSFNVKVTSVWSWKSSKVFCIIRHEHNSEWAFPANLPFGSIVTEFKPKECHQG